MKVTNRILLYFILIIGYVLYTYIFFMVGPLLPFKAVFWNAFLFFSLFDCIVAFLFLKSIPIVTIPVGMVMAWLSLMLAFKFSDFYYPPSDAYGIQTTIIANIVFSILCWEIAYQIKEKVTHKSI